MSEEGIRQLLQIAICIDMQAERLGNGELDASCAWVLWQQAAGIRQAVGEPLTPSRHRGRQNKEVVRRAYEYSGEGRS
jgi:hypothetical protein